MLVSTHSTFHDHSDFRKLASIKNNEHNSYAYTFRDLSLQFLFWYFYVGNDNFPCDVHTTSIQVVMWTAT